MRKFLYSFALIALLVFSLTSCVKHEFDEPPAAGDPFTGTVDYTIAELLSFHELDKVNPITVEKTFAGTVVSNDFAGNFYKSLVLQDATGGILLRINKNDINADYPIGTKLYVKTNGLFVGDYRGLAQLGGGKTVVGTTENTEYFTDDQITSNIINSNTVTAIVPQTVSIASLSPTMLNTLVKFENVEFVTGDAGQPYADADNSQSLNRILSDCSGNTVAVRSSGFSAFAATNTPTGNGTLVGVLSVFSGTYQITLNDIEPVNVSMDGTRCGGGGTTGTMVDYTIGELLTNYHEVDKVNEIDINKVIGGTVISSDLTGNFYKTLVIQDATGGISLRLNKFDIYQTYAVGSVIHIKTDGLVLGDYNGLPQLGGAKTVDAMGNENTEYFSDGQIASNIELTSNNNPITPNVIATTALNTDLVNTLVSFNDVQFIDADSGQTYADAANQQSLNRKIEDCDGNIVTVRTSGYADFAGTNTPTGKGTITGILSVFGGTFQLLLVDAGNSSVSMNGGRCGGGTGPTNLDENFSSQTNNENIVLTGWSNTAVQGTRVWIGKEYSGNTYAQASAYNSAEASSEAWLITPAINVDVATKKINFETAKAYYDHDGLSVWISTDFAGDVTAANWTQLNPTIAQSSDDDHAFIPSGDVSLSSYMGSEVYIGFKYLGGDPGATGTYRIDNVVVSE